jgi:hypothetical protein
LLGIASAVFLGLSATGLMSIIFLSFIGKRKYIEGVVQKTVYSVQKVPRHCLLVLLIGVKHMIRNNSEFNFYDVRRVAFERNLI